jgi:hypothetical protein
MGLARRRSDLHGGAVFGYGLARWADLSALRLVRVQDVAVPVAGLLTVAVLAGLTGLALTVTAHRAATGWPAFRGWALVSVALRGCGARRCRHVRYPPCRRRRVGGWHDG